MFGHILERMVKSKSSEETIKAIKDGDTFSSSNYSLITLNNNVSGMHVAISGFPSKRRLSTLYKLQFNKRIKIGIATNYG